MSGLGKRQRLNSRTVFRTLEYCPAVQALPFPQAGHLFLSAIRPARPRILRFEKVSGKKNRAGELRCNDDERSHEYRLDLPLDRRGGQSLRQFEVRREYGS